MGVVKLKVSLKSNPHVYRVMEIPDTYNLAQLHHFILKAYEFDPGEFASFYLNYENRKDMIEICLSDMQKDGECTLMKNVRIRDVIKTTEDKLTYIYDFLNMWTFDIEAIQTNMKEKEGAKYPAVVESIGEPPKPEDGSGFNLEDLSPEDMELMRELMQSNEEMFDDELGFDSDFSDEDFEDYSDFEDDEYKY